jgi:hypothetical protein
LKNKPKKRHFDPKIMTMRTTQLTATIWTVACVSCFVFYEWT